MKCLLSFNINLKKIIFFPKCLIYTAPLKNGCTISCGSITLDIAIDWQQEMSMCLGEVGEGCFLFYTK